MNNTFRCLYRVAALISIALGASNCQPKNGSSSPSFADTLNYIKKNGFPSLDEIMPELPEQFSYIEGINSDSFGHPQVPVDFTGLSLNPELNLTANDFDQLLDDAKGLSAQGFSEARRIENLTRNYLSPVFDLLSQANVFQKQASGSSSSSTGGTQLLQSGSVVENIFSELTNQLEFLVSLPEIDGMPHYLTLSAEKGQESIRISGLWDPVKIGLTQEAASTDQLMTGFSIKVRLVAIDDYEFDLAFAPSLVKGLIPQWSSSSCEDDLFRINLSRSDTVGQQLSVNSHECPSTRNAITTLGISINPDTGAKGIRGGFAQDFDIEDEDSLRGWLGAKQGFVMLASTDSGNEKLAAAAAVLGEKDFSDPKTEIIDEFGVGRLLSRYVQALYWSPLYDEASKLNIFNGSSNLAYWTCFSSLTKQVFSDASDYVSDLCQKNDLDVEPFIETMTVVRDTINDYSPPSSIKTTVNGIVDVIEIRNEIFIGSEGEIAYKDAPDDDYKSLAEARSELGLEVLADLSWQAGTKQRLASLSRSDLPNSLFSSSADAINSFLKKTCESLIEDASGKAKKDTDKESGCSF